MPLIQIRSVPDDIHRTLKARAALEGKSLSDYVLAEVARTAATPTAELVERLRQRGSRGISTAAILEARDSGRRE
jgi:antitoxin FitA